MRAGEDERTFTGSGTLVTYKGIHYILTAKHVWSKIERSKCEFIGVNVAREGRGDFYRILARAVVAIDTGPSSSEEWGPDLALLPVRAAFASRPPESAFRETKTLPSRAPS